MLRRCGSRAGDQIKTVQGFGWCGPAEDDVVVERVRSSVINVTQLSLVPVACPDKTRLCAYVPVCLLAWDPIDVGWHAYCFLIKCRRASSRNGVTTENGALAVEPLLGCSAACLLVCLSAWPQHDESTTQDRACAVARVGSERVARRAMGIAFAISQKPSAKSHQPKAGSRS